jgi:deazaflavin-dependent oxidoreductase (nitroreductase family)
MVRRIPRRLARAPIPLLRHGFGWLTGGGLVLLEHRGRSSGLLRQVVLEVVGRDPEHVRVVSGYGAAAQWYRNVLAEPRVRVWIGRHRAVPGVAVSLPAERAWSVLEDYRARHPRAARALGRTLDIAELARGGQLPADIAERLPVVEVELGRAG